MYLGSLQSSPNISLLFVLSLTERQGSTGMVLLRRLKIQMKDHLAKNEPNCLEHTAEDTYK